jgi:hypothetical protein
MPIFMIVHFRSDRGSGGGVSEREKLSMTRGEEFSVPFLGGEK